MTNRRSPLLVSLIVTATLIAPAFVAVSAVAAPALGEVHLIDGFPVVLDKPSGTPGHGGGGGGGGTPSQPAQVTPWGISHIGADTVWGHNTGGGILVAVVDTGIQPDHPDLQGKIVDGIRFYTRGVNLYSDNKWADDNGHGTHVSGTVAALDNTIGVVGVAPDVEFLAVKVLDKSGSGSYAAVAAGINWAVSHGADVITMSLGGSATTTAMSNAVSNAISNGVIVVAAAGNSGDGNPSTTEVSYPGAYPGVITVGATDSSDNVASWSSSAPYIEVCGPGVSILSTYKGSTYKTLSGTSMATPHVTGTVALLLDSSVTAPAGGWTSYNVGSYLSAHATDIGANSNSCGGGEVDASQF